jgi:hypothetical protein
LTTSVAIIIFLIVNGVGVIAAVWLAHISAERRKHTISEQYPITPKEPRLRNANRQIRDRAARAFCQMIFIFLGAMDILGVKLPFDGTVWLFLALAGILTLVSVIDLYGEIVN